MTVARERPRAVVVATSPFHLEMFASLRELAGSIDVSLAASASLSVAGAHQVPDGVFALHGARRVSAMAHRAAAAAAMLADLRPDVLVVGNDVAPIERALIGAARSRDLPVVLLQDGLFPAWSGAWRRRVGRLIVRAGHPELAPTVYGIGEWTHAGVLGPAWVAPLATGRDTTARLARPVGNCAFAATIHEVKTRDAGHWRREIGLTEAPTAIFFTTDLLRGLGGVNRTRHLRQARAVRDSAATLTRLGWTVRVRLHPAERPDDYAGLIDPGLILDREIPLSGAIGAADVGLVSGSAVSLMLAAAGRGVGWPVMGGGDPAERAAARWLGIPLVHDVPAVASTVPSVDARRLAELLVDDRDDPSGSRSVRLIAEAARPW